jgi:hypothetical protein
LRDDIIAFPVTRSTLEIRDRKAYLGINRPLEETPFEAKKITVGFDLLLNEAAAFPQGIYRGNVLVVEIGLYDASRIRKELEAKATSMAGELRELRRYIREILRDKASKTGQL